MSPLWYAKMYHRSYLPDGQILRTTADGDCSLETLCDQTRGMSATRIRALCEHATDTKRDVLEQLAVRAEIEARIWRRA